MGFRVQRLLLLLWVGAVLVAGRPTDVNPGISQVASAVENAVETAKAEESVRSRRGILFSTHGYPGLVYPSFTYPYPYPGYFDLRYPSFTYPSYPTLSAYPGYPLLIG